MVQFIQHTFKEVIFMIKNLQDEMNLTKLLKCLVILKRMRVVCFTYLANGSTLRNSMKILGKKFKEIWDRAIV